MVSATMTATTMLAPERHEKKISAALDENNQALDELLCCLRGFGDRGHKRIALFIEEVRVDGKSHPGGL